MTVETIFVLDMNDKDSGEKKWSGRYVAEEGQEQPAASNIYLNRTFVGQKGSTAKRVKATFEIID
jgi:hypothetical protein